MSVRTVEPGGPYKAVGMVVDSPSLNTATCTTVLVENGATPAVLSRCGKGGLAEVQCVWCL